MAGLYSIALHHCSAYNSSEPAKKMHAHINILTGIKARRAQNPEKADLLKMLHLYLHT